MVDPTTVNTSLAIPIRGSDVGTWDLPVNGNFNIIDNMFGGVTTIALTNIDVTLLSSQAQASVIRLTGTLSAHVKIIMTSIFKGLRFDNQTVNSLSSFSAFATTPGSSYFAGIPPGVNDMFYDGTKIDWANLGKVGEYWDCVAGGVPTWVGGSTKPPYLVCSGGTFSSSTYPVLAATLGSTTLPDARGRVRMMSNLGTGRVTVFNGDTLYNAGGDEQVQGHTHTGSGTTSIENATHAHTASGTTASENANHTHNGSGTTVTENQAHTHAGSGFTANENAFHTHTYNEANYSVGNLAPVGASFTQITILGGTTSTESTVHQHTYSFTTATESAIHDHNYSFTTGTESSVHQHTFSFTTAAENANHAHTYSFTTSSYGGGASQNMQPTYVGGITMIRAA